MKSLKKPKKRYRIVIDANVITSSIFGGYPAKVMEIAKSHILFAPTRLKKGLETFLEKVRKRGDFTELVNYFSYILHFKILTPKEFVEMIEGKL